MQTKPELAVVSALGQSTPYNPATMHISYVYKVRSLMSHKGCCVCGLSKKMSVILI